MREWIIMGDVVNSSNADQIALQKNFAQLIKMINESFKEELASPLTITLGDEFQGIVKSPEDVAFVLVALEEYRWRLELPILMRYSVTLGEIDTEINPVIAYGMLGSGLMEAREALVEMKSAEDRLVLNGDFPRKRQMALSLNLLLELQEQWKWKDRDIINGYFLYKDYKKVAEVLGKDISLMWRRFKSLDFTSYQKRKKLVNLIYGDRD
ncbi:SatD family protein [Algoriphagus sp. AGSA1]|uniref:SatD family protein n=1 Tax=Algoriphagus sp. AGSA1 TaxID=2907213 RepID=UPI001F37162D|nr:SatD family protein [Algoriphagus sp. AGSA1]MCE7057629.1 SatD family protein [Algoriphagus sp. AGSA1]